MSKLQPIYLKEEQWSFLQWFIWKYDNNHPMVDSVKMVKDRGYYYKELDGDNLNHIRMGYGDYYNMYITDNRDLLKDLG